nr:hypothetical protein [Clostridia bacterium]
MTYVFADEDTWIKEYEKLTGSREYYVYRSKTNKPASYAVVIYDLPLEVQDTKNRSIEYGAIRPDTVKVRFDRMVTKTLPINLEMSGVTIPEGYLMDEEHV